MFEKVVSFIQEIYGTNEYIPLHEPRFIGEEKKRVEECIESTFVSSVGKFVDQFEHAVADFTGAKQAVAIVNGTQALFLALKMAGADGQTEIITQSLTFVATTNAIHYTGAKPVFLDVDLDTMGLSPVALQTFLEENTYLKDNKCWNKTTNREIVACLPMHTCGHPCRIEEIRKICEAYYLVLIEDAAESLGSYTEGTHTGNFGRFGILSFNGNKIMTTGGGGMILCNDELTATQAKHLSTTAKVDHPWEFNHDEIGYNFRMPNLNAALGVAQLENLTDFIKNKRELAHTYEVFFKELAIEFFVEREGTQSNYWLNAILLKDRQERDEFLKKTNDHGVMTRCLWTPMHQLSMYQTCQRDALNNTETLFSRVVNIPSSVRI